MFVCTIFTSAASALTADRSPEQILKERDALQVPRIEASKANDEEYRKEFVANRAMIWSKRDALILELLPILGNSDDSSDFRLRCQWQHLL